MSRRLLTAMVILATASPSLYSQAPPTRPLRGRDLADARIEAAKYAFANGFELRSTDLVVGFEMGFERIHVAKHLDATAELQSQAAAISIAIGHSSKPGSAAQLLTCRQGACAPNTRTSVLLIDEPSTNDESVTSLTVRLYDPSDAVAYDALLTHGVLELEKKDGGWRGVRFRLGPSTVKVKLPAK